MSMVDTERQIVAILHPDEGPAEIKVGSVQMLAHWVRHQEYADARIGKVYAVDGGDLVEVSWSTSMSPYDENDWAWVKVKVVFPDGKGDIASYRVDGRS